MTEGFPHSPLFGENGRNKNWISLLRSDLATPSARCATPPICSAELRKQRETWRHIFPIVKSLVEVSCI